jgi:hypothetical protein
VLSRDERWRSELLEHDAAYLGAAVVRGDADLVPRTVDDRDNPRYVAVDTNGPERNRLTGHHGASYHRADQ